VPGRLVGWRMLRLKVRQSEGDAGLHGQKNDIPTTISMTLKVIVDSVTV
jgi:hypothetical protein